MDAPHPYARTFKGSHANGWESWVAENASGDFIVWICPAGENAVVDCVEDSLTHALSAASNAMRDRTGHRCGAGRLARHLAAHL